MKPVIIFSIEDAKVLKEHLSKSKSKRDKEVERIYRDLKKQIKLSEI